MFMGSLPALRTFVEVYRLHSVSAAAAALGLTQPAASGHVRAIEAVVGRPLFVRHARGVRPTPAADALAAALGDAFDRIEAALALHRVRGVAAEAPVRLIAPVEFGSVVLAPMVGDLARQGFTVHLALGGRAAIHAALAGRQADIAITASEPDDPALGAAPVREERFVPVAAPAWIAARLDGRAELETARHLPPVAYDATLSHLRAALELLPPAPPPDPAAVVPDLRIVRDLTVQGAGWSVIPDYLCAAELADGRLRELAAPGHVTNRLFLVWRRSALREGAVVRARAVLAAALGAQIG